MGMGDDLGGYDLNAPFGSQSGDTDPQRTLAETLRKAMGVGTGSTGDQYNPAANTAMSGFGKAIQGLVAPGGPAGGGHAAQAPHPAAPPTNNNSVSAGVQSMLGPGKPQSPFAPDAGAGLGSGGKGLTTKHPIYQFS